jgi:ribosomal protein L14
LCGYTGVANAKVIQIYGNFKKRVATYGDMVYVVVKSLDKSSGNLLDDKQRKKYRKGTLHRAVIVHTKKKIQRVDHT